MQLGSVSGRQFVVLLASEMYPNMAASNGNKILVDNNVSTNEQQSTLTTKQLVNKAHVVVMATASALQRLHAQIIR